MFKSLLNFSYNKKLSDRKYVSFNCGAPGPGLTAAVISVSSVAARPLYLTFYRFTFIGSKEHPLKYLLL